MRAGRNPEETGAEVLAERAGNSELRPPSRPHDGRHQDGLTTEERQELQRLRRKNKVPREESDPDDPRAVAWDPRRGSSGCAAQPQRAWAAHQERVDVLDSLVAALELRELVEQLVELDPRFEARERCAEAEMVAEPEGQVTGGVARHVERRRARASLALVSICRPEQRDYV